LTFQYQPLEVAPGGFEVEIMGGFTISTTYDLI
jgi:hypothetical protein